MRRLVARRAPASRRRRTTACRSSRSARSSVYAARGDLQLVVKSHRGAGRRAVAQGARADARRGSTADGLLDPARKRALPRYPRRVAVITSPDGAAMHDIVAVARRRCAAGRDRRRAGEGTGRRRGRGAARGGRAGGHAGATSTSSSSGVAAARARTCGPSTTSSSRAPWPPVPSRSCRPSDTRWTSRSATSSPTCARRRRRPPPKPSCRVLADVRDEVRALARVAPRGGRVRTCGWRASASPIAATISRARRCASRSGAARSSRRSPGGCTR